MLFSVDVENVMHVIKSDLTNLFLKLYNYIVAYFRLPYSVLLAAWKIVYITVLYIVVILLLQIQDYIELLIRIFSG